MKITDVSAVLLRGNETYGSRSGDAEATDQGDWLLLVRVATDEGLEGWADVETLGPVASRVITGQSMSAMGFRTLRDELVGKDPLDVEHIWNDMYLATAYYGRRGVAMHCISAVDNCLWSIRALAAGTDLATTLGRRHHARIPAYASTLFRATPSENAVAAQRYVNLGFRGVKFGWGGFGVDAGRDRENLAAIRDVLGPTRAFMTDPGWYVLDEDGRPRVRTDAQTRTMLRTLAAVAPYWVEDFLHPEQPGAYCRFKAEFGQLRFAAGEQQATMWDFERLIEEAQIDVIQPDLSRCGGLTVAKQLRPRARAAHKQVVTHSWLTDLLHAYSLHFLATLGDARWVEFNVAQSALSRGVTREHLKLEADGTLAVPDGPGVGVEVDTEFVASAAVTL